MSTHVRSSISFLTGDTRATVTTGLTTAHNMFVRYHNYVARKLHRINKHWKNNKVFYKVGHI